MSNTITGGELQKHYLEWGDGRLYSPPIYAARWDWMHVLDFGGPTGTWQLQFTIYWKTFATAGMATPSTSPGGGWDCRAVPAVGDATANNNVRAVPPEIASRVFARSLAVRPVADYPDLVLGWEVVPTMDETVNFST